MTNEVRTAFSAAAVANAAAQVAIAAEHLVNADPSSWELVDKVYWLCRDTAKKAQETADCLDPDWAEVDPTVVYAYSTATAAVENANETADNLVSLAEATGHEIRR